MPHQDTDPNALVAEIEAQAQALLDLRDSEGLEYALRFIKRRVKWAKAELAHTEKLTQRAANNKRRA